MDPLRGLLPFVRVAESGGFRAAAKTLGVTAAAVSKAVKALEEELGVPLFERTTREVRLTVEGAELFRRAAEALALVDAATRDVRDARSRPRGEVRVSVSPVLVGWVAPVLTKLLSRHAELSLDLRVTDRIATLFGDEIDVAVRVGAGTDDRVVATKLCDTTWVTVAAPELLGRLRMESQASGPWVVYRHRSGAVERPKVASAEGAFVAVDGPYVAACSTGDAMLQLVRAGAGMCQLLDVLAEPLLAEGALVEVQRQWRRRGPSLTVVSLRGRRSVPRIRAVVDALREGLATPPRRDGAEHA